MNLNGIVDLDIVVSKTVVALYSLEVIPDGGKCKADEWIIYIKNKS